MSPTTRRAWIEICWKSFGTTPPSVALLAEGVDRNLFDIIQPHILRVALLAEGVDRNQKPKLSPWIRAVALLAEGVDRNVP